MLLSHQILLFAAAAFAANSSNSTSSNKYVKLDYEVKIERLPSSKRLQGGVSKRQGFSKRQASEEFDLDDNDKIYVVDLNIGSPGQKNSVIVDTGSSDLWVMSKDVHCVSHVSKRSFGESSGLLSRRLFDLERSDPDSLSKRQNSSSTTSVIGGRCVEGGSFSPNKSSSFFANSSMPKLNTSYGDGNFAKGSFGNDYINFGGKSIPGCSFAIVDNTTAPIGIMGIGLASNEASNYPGLADRLFVYDNTPVWMKKSGAIDKVMYSIFMNDTTKKTGSVLFGAVDHSKYSGKLQTVPVLATQPERGDKPFKLDVVLNSLTIESSSQNITALDSPIAVLLDSGASLTYLPEPVFNYLGHLMNGKLHSSGLYKVDCGYKTTSITLTFNFSGIKIKVPLSDMISTQGSDCFLGVFSSGYENGTESAGTLGQNFFRNAYIAFDLEDYEISLAQIASGGKENIEAVSKAVPSASKAAGYSSTSLAKSLSTSSPKLHLKIPDSKTSSASQGFRLVESAALALTCAVFVFAL